MIRGLLGSGALLAVLVVASLPPTLGGPGRSAARQLAGTPLTAAASPAPAQVEASSLLLGQTEFPALPWETATMRFGTLSLPPGSPAVVFQHPGPVLLVVAVGTVTIDADAALVSQPGNPGADLLAPLAATAAPLQDATVLHGQQVLLAAGVLTSVRNTGAALARVYVISFTASGALPASATPAA